MNKNSLLDYPKLIKEWHPNKNGGLDPSTLTKGLGKKVWWQCSKGHEWKASISSRTQGRGCPVCAGRKVLKGVNDLATVKPELAKEWHPTKNEKIMPYEVTKGSNKKIWWLGKCGHEWQADVNGRAKGRGCPFCANKRVLKGYNDLATIKPELAKEWHPTKNKKMKPDMVVSKSSKKVWWQCRKGHEWQATISSRVSGGRGCPVCNRELQTSFPEQAIYYYVKKIFPDAISVDNKTIGMELDIYIPTEKIAIEYDGYRWHKNKKNEQNKNTLCKKKGIELIRIREDGLDIYEDCHCIIRSGDKDDDSLVDVINQILEIINKDTKKITVDVVKDRTKIYEEYIKSEKERSLKEIYPELSKEWHPIKNGKLTPEMVSSGSNKIVWWLGKCGHNWQASVTVRVRGSGCPICAGYKILEGYNDLLSTNPSLSKEWHPTKNGELKPNMITSGSSRKVWWLGCCGHEWRASIQNRAKGSSCPICSGNKVLAGFNDLKTSNPKLVEEWHPTKNNNLEPTMVVKQSNKSVWWLGKCGHEWKARIQDRVNGNGCPICAGKIVLVNYNDLKTKNPRLAREWHPTKNETLLPTQVTNNSGKSVWWKCSKGHEWKATIRSRNSGTGCPYCSGRLVIKGFNDLETMNPRLAKEWHPTKNGELMPSDVLQQSNKKIWWLGPCGHEWKMTISSRSNGQGCPYCASKRILRGYNDLCTVNPKLAKEWHPTKNKDKTPNQFFVTSHTKVWWLGKCGHEWEDTIAHRSYGRKCPFCSGRKIQRGFNDLKTINPDLAREWHPTKNGDLLPSQVTKGSNKKVWWICKNGHEWQATIKNRSNGTGCPFCKREGNGE